MKKHSNLELLELTYLLSAIEKLCKSDYAHIQHLEPVKRLIQLCDSQYQIADNILTERENAKC